MKIKKSAITDMEALGDSQVFDGAAKILELHTFRKNGHAQKALMKGAALLKRHGLHEVGQLAKRNSELILNIKDCISVATGRMCDCLKTASNIIQAIVKTLEHPCSAKKKMIEVAQAFCAELARRLFRDAHQPV